jgi:hypothetical protein
LAGAALVVAVLAGAVLRFTVLPVVRPSADRVSPADAVVMLSGDQGNRLNVSLRLIAEGVAPTLVIVGIPDLPRAKELCGPNPGFEVVCLSPQPDRTETEARATGELARSRAWHHIVVVTDPVHFARARLLFRRCVSGKVSVVGEPPPASSYDAGRAFVHEWTGLAYYTFAARGC